MGRSWDIQSEVYHYCASLKLKVLLKNFVQFKTQNSCYAMLNKSLNSKDTNWKAHKM